MNKIYIAFFLLLNFSNNPSLVAQVSTEGLGVFQKEVDQVLFQQGQDSGDEVIFYMNIHIEKKWPGWEEELAYYFMNDSLVKTTYSEGIIFTSKTEYFGLITGNDILEYDTSRHALVYPKTFKDSAGYEVQIRKILYGKDSADTYLRFKRDSLKRPAESFFKSPGRSRLYTWEYKGDSIEIMRTYHFSDSIPKLVLENYTHTSVRNKIGCDTIITTSYTTRTPAAATVKTMVVKTYYTYDISDRLIEVEKNEFDIENSPDTWIRKDVMKIKYKNAEGH
jgi:hypothetical protein